MISPTVAFFEVTHLQQQQSMLLVAHVRERPWTVGLKVNAVETEYDATVHGILGNLRGGFGDMIAFRHAMRGHTF